MEKKSCPYLSKGFLNEWSFSNKIWNRLTRKRLGLKFYMNHSWNSDCLDTLWVTRWTLNQFVVLYRGGNRTELSNKSLMKSDYWWIWWFNDWSRWEDLNLRPLRPEVGILLQTKIDSDNDISILNINLCLKESFQIHSSTLLYNGLQNNWY